MAEYSQLQEYWPPAISRHHCFENVGVVGPMALAPSTWSRGFPAPNSAVGVQAVRRAE